MGPAGQGEKRRWSKRIAGRLIIAFVATSLLTGFAAVTGIIAINNVGRVLDETTSQQLPAMLNALSLSRQVERVTSLAPALFAAPDADSQQAVRRRVEPELTRMRTELEMLRKWAPDPNVVDALQADVTELERLIDESFDLIRQRRELSVRRDVLRDRIFAFRSRLENLIEPWLQVAGKGLDLLDGNPAPSGGTAAQPSGESALSAMAARSLTISRTRDRAGELVDRLLQADSVSDADKLDVLSFQADRAADGLKGLAREVSPELGAVVAQEVDQFAPVLSPSQGLIALRKSELALDRRASDLVEETRQLSSALSHAVDTMLDDRNGRLDSALAKTGAVRGGAFLALALAGGASILGTLCIVVFYVMRRVLSRLNGLTQAMGSLAAGDLATNIPYGGDTDEIGDLAGALETFRGAMRERAELAASMEQVNEQLEHKVAIRTRELAEANAAKSMFLASMTHEIRTPLSGIVGMAELAQDAGGSSEQGSYLKVMRESAQSLLTVVNDMLDFSRLEAGALEYEMAPFNPRDVITSVMTLLGPSANDKRLDLDFQEEAGVPTLVEGDSARYRQVLLNLIGNAVKFTDKGKVTVALSIVERDQIPHVRTQITDTGIGIAPAARSRLFRSYGQADATIVRRFGGSGLGLSICRQIVEQQAGRIDFSSVEGEGSRFWFDLPLREAGAATPAPTVASPVAIPANLNVLLCEDTPVNRTVALGFLRRWGHKVDVAEDGRVAVEMAARGGYDVILMDIHMPELDGIAATRLIRQLAGKPGAVPIIAATAGAADVEMEACRNAGMNGFLAKPFDGAMLASSLADALGAPGAGAINREANAAPTEAPPASQAMVEALSQLIHDFGENWTRDLTGIFISQSETFLRDIERYLDEGRAADAAFAAHAMIAPARSVGCIDLARCARNLQAACSNEEVDQARQQLATAERLFETARQAFAPDSRTWLLVREHLSEVAAG
ncbi:ATP-binding protein [Radicibacter daui]|uniref:ATP-binding protein n=1 Tax=Radicibacter daui TaxID=3064829 RepID=UPI004046921C